MSHLSLTHRELAKHRPDPIFQYWVEVDGVRWPVKQVMALATGLSKSDFRSQQSRRVLKRLGFLIGKDEEVAVTPSASTRPKQSNGAHQRAQPHEASTSVVLIGCVKRKRAVGAPAKDLYISDYFAKMRAYAENVGLPWFILSAEHGLVVPDSWLDPYDCYLPDMSRDYRRAWGREVATQLEETLGTLDGVVIDIHAGAAYLAHAEVALRALGAVVIDQLKGLSLGRRLSWYLQHGARSTFNTREVADSLRDGSQAVALVELLATNGAGLHTPGMYSWWVDEAGAGDLSKGLGHDIAAGLIYAGLAGATRSGGSKSSNTLWGRIATMHLGKRHNLSTLRLSLGSILAGTHTWPAIDEAQLTHWMYAHLSVVAIPVADADSLGDLETKILAELDPPLNLAKVSRTPLRSRLSVLRKQYAGVTAQVPAEETAIDG